MSEILTLGLGNFGCQIVAHWVNSTSRFDREHSVVYMETAAGPVPRVLMLDSGQPSAVVAQQPLGGAGTRPSDVFPEPDEALHRAAARLRNCRWLAEEEEESDVDAEAESDADGAAKPQARADSEAEPEEAFSYRPKHTPWSRFISTSIHPDTVAFMKPTGVLQSTGGDGDEDMPSEQPPDVEAAFGLGLVSSPCGWTLEKDTVLNGFHDNVRCMLEAMDGCQAVQLFVDSDSAFGGIAHQLMLSLREEFASTAPLVCHSAFTGEDVEENAESQSIQALRRREQHDLNRLLALHYLSGEAHLYTPYEIQSWKRSLGNSGVSPSDRIASSALIAAAADTVLYPARVGGMRAGELCSMLRPRKALRVCAALGTLPRMLFEPTECLPLWDVLSARAPLLGAPFLRMSFPVRLDEVDTPKGQIAAHAVRLRGFGALSDAVYPREEALLRYVAPLRTSMFDTFICPENYPISCTFPEELVPRSVTSVPAAAHIVNTAAAGPYLCAAHATADRILRVGRHRHAALYCLEYDEWREATDDVAALRDSYDSGAPHSEGEGDDSD